jgi:hypothetical protein
MEKQAIIKNIIKELDKIPLVYLQSLYQIIRTFRKHLPVATKKMDVLAVKPTEDNFDWDELIDNVHANRKRNNERMHRNIEHLIP